MRLPLYFCIVIAYGLLLLLACNFFSYLCGHQEVSGLYTDAEWECRHVGSSCSLSACRACLALRVRELLFL